MLGDASTVTMPFEKQAGRAKFCIRGWSTSLRRGSERYDQLYAHLESIRGVQPDSAEGCADCLAQGSCWVRLRECLHDWSPGGSVAIGALGTYAATARLRHSGGLVIQLVSVHRPSRVPSGQDKC